MDVSLINGSFAKQDALDLLSQLVATKIRYHENKIAAADQEEDIKTRERKIQQLQNDLAEIRKELEHSGEVVTLSGVLKVSS